MQEKWPPGPMWWMNRARCDSGPTHIPKHSMILHVWNIIYKYIIPVVGAWFWGCFRGLALGRKTDNVPLPIGCVWEGISSMFPKTSLLALDVGLCGRSKGDARAPALAPPQASGKGAWGLMAPVQFLLLELKRSKHTWKLPTLATSLLFLLGLVLDEHANVLPVWKI